MLRQKELLQAVLLFEYGYLEVCGNPDKNLCWPDILPDPGQREPVEADRSWRQREWKNNR